MTQTLAIDFVQFHGTLEIGSKIVCACAVVSAGRDRHVFCTGLLFVESLVLSGDVTQL